jgi:putative ABC transport system permease protein
VETDVKLFLKQRHMVSPDDEIALNSFSLKQIFDMFTMLELGINALIWIVGIGTLLAGVVGVSNIMIVTVSERTQEIGVRRALGATPSAIISQIMSESFVLTATAGLAGLIAGVGALIGVEYMIQYYPSKFFVNPQVSFGAAFAALAVLVVFGLLAGFLPSKKALEIKAIDALRDE